MAGPLGIVHVHSAYSHDGRDSIEDLRRFAEARGIAFIGLTDHAEDFDGARFAELAAECRRVSDAAVAILPGLEYRFRGRKGLHLLALGLSRWIAPTTPAEFVEQARDAAGLTIAAHPLLYRHELPEEVGRGIDAVEVWNAAYNTRLLPDPRAIRLLHRWQQRRPELVGVFGLDQHDAGNDRGLRVRLADAGEPDPLGALRAGRFRNLGRGFDLDGHCRMGAVALTGLSALRTGLDVVNAVHERVMRARNAKQP
jgi:hypothetical protein